MVKKLLITGASGFVGGHFVDHLIETSPDIGIYGTIRERSNLDHLSRYGKKITLCHCEMTDPSSVRETLKEVEPDYLVHLAGQSSIIHSWNQPHSLLDANVISTINILEGMKDLRLFNARVLIIGSSDCYGIIDKHDFKIPEHYPLKPFSLYAITKELGEPEIFADVPVRLREIL